MGEGSMSFSSEIKNKLAVYDKTVQAVDDVEDFLVLVEEENEQGEGMLTGRLSNNLLVHFYGDTSMIGKIVPVYLKECKGFYYIGELKL